MHINSNILTYSQYVKEVYICALNKETLRRCEDAPQGDGVVGFPQSLGMTTKRPFGRKIQIRSLRVTVVVGFPQSLGMTTRRSFGRKIQSLRVTGWL